MTNIKISGELPHDVTLYLRLGNQAKELDSNVKEVTFTTDLSGKYWLEIEEAPAAHEEKINNPCLFLLYTLISSAIYVFQRIGDSGKWEKDIKAYLFKGRFEIDLVDTIEIELIYLPSEYHEGQASWGYPSLQVQQSLKSEIEFNENPLDFQNKLNDYIRSFVTVCTVVVLFFGFIALKAILGGATSIAIAFSLMVIGVVALAIGVVRSQRKKCRKLYENFVSKKTVSFEDAGRIVGTKDPKLS
jgi:hypothetical protein